MYEPDETIKLTDIDNLWSFDLNCYIIRLLDIISCSPSPLT